MALVKTDGTIISISGRFGGVYFKTTKNSIQVQAMPRTVRYNRVGIQGANRNAFSMFILLFIQAVAAALLLMWLTFSILYYFITRNRQKRKIAAVCWFAHFGMKVGVETGLPPPLPPPSPTNIPDYYGITNGYQGYSPEPDIFPAHWIRQNFSYGGDYGGKPSYYGDQIADWVMWWDGAHYCITPQAGTKPLGKTWTNYDTYRAGVYEHDTTNDKTTIVTWKAAYKP